MLMPAVQIFIDCALSHTCTVPRMPANEVTFRTASLWEAKSLHRQIRRINSSAESSSGAFYWGRASCLHEFALKSKELALSFTQKIETGDLHVSKWSSEIQHSSDYNMFKLFYFSVDLSITGIFYDLHRPLLVWL